VIFLLALQLRLGLLSMPKARKHKKKILIKSPNFIVIMAILTEMVRHLNENISKVELKPLRALGTRGIIESAKAVGEVSQA
jgi:hypothetical protein